MFFNIFSPKFKVDTDLLDANLPDTYSPAHPESGATTAEYGMLAGGVALGGGIIYTIVKSPFFEELVKKIMEFLGNLIIETIQGMVSASSMGLMVF